MRRKAAHNGVYVAIAGEVVNRRSVHLRNFVLNGQVSASNPLLHIHAKRYRQVQKDREMNNLLQNKDREKKPTHKTAHLQIARLDTQPKFAKELFSCQRCESK